MGSPQHEELYQGVIVFQWLRTIAIDYHGLKQETDNTKTIGLSPDTEIFNAHVYTFQEYFKKKLQSNNPRDFRRHKESKYA